MAGQTGPGGAMRGEVDVERRGRVAKLLMECTCVATWWLNLHVESAEIEHVFILQF